MMADNDHAQPKSKLSVYALILTLSVCLASQSGARAEPASSTVAQQPTVLAATGGPATLWGSMRLGKQSGRRQIIRITALGMCLALFILFRAKN